MERLLITWLLCCKIQTLLRPKLIGEAPPSTPAPPSLKSLNLHNQSNAAVNFTVYPHRLVTQAAEAGWPPAMTQMGQYHTGLCHAVRDQGDSLKSWMVDFNHPRDFACAAATAPLHATPMITPTPQLWPAHADGRWTGCW
jgi:hypothetical protein